jgi:hypothetical protein
MSVWIPNVNSMIVAEFNDDGGAIFSVGRKYRYKLWRKLDHKNPLRILWIMLNPSTADAKIDDATIKKIRKYSARLGFGEFQVVNVYAYRATNPKELQSVEDPFGEENDYILMDAIKHTDRIVCAWGANAGEDGRKLAALIRSMDVPMKCLKINKDGSPAHPLYQPDAAELIDFV